MWRSRHEHLPVTTVPRSRRPTVFTSLAQASISPTKVLGAPPTLRPVQGHFRTHTHTPDEKKRLPTMVFPGHFSTGCGRCRRRKVKVSLTGGLTEPPRGGGHLGVAWLRPSRGASWTVFADACPCQCDERKPTCRRCYIYGKPCPGYSDQFQFRYRRNSSQKAVEPGHGSQAGSAPSESGRSDISTSNPGDSPPAGAVQSHTGVAAPQLTVPAVLAPSLEHMSLCYFVRRFVSPNYADSYPGHLSFLPGLLNFDNYGILELATMSVAQIATYNIYGGSQLLQNAYGNYGRAITALRDMVETETLPADDRTTSAIMLLCNFMVRDLIPSLRFSFLFFSSAPGPCR